ncbi:MAG TPA: transporter substrate-binding domain-containing protein, partial [Spirochaetota bacterium]|nr:transporter substrate-binding domain-containing protein [Spirochaetota bacterium]
MAGILCAILFVLSVHDLSASFVLEKRPVIHAGVFDDSPPFHFVKDGSLVGFDIDLIKIAADNVGYDVEFTTGDEDRIMNGLASGAYDIVIDAVRNHEMESKYALSITTSVITYGVFVKGDDIRNEIDLLKSRIAMSEGVLKMGIFPPPHTVHVFTFTDSGEKAFKELERGNVDAVIFPELRGREICRKMNLAEVRQLENYNISEERCVVAAKNNAKLIRSINTGISLMKEKGQFFNLYMRWFFGKEEFMGRRILKWIISITVLLMVLFAISLFFVHTLRKHVRRRTRELAESEEKYRTLVENIPQSIFVKDRRSVYITCNDNFAADLGVKRDEVTGKSDYDYYPPDLADKYRCDDSRIMETGAAECLIEQYLSRGCRRWIHTVKTPMRNEKGVVSGILGIIWDITDNKIREDDLRESERRLSMAERVANVGSWELDVLKGAMVWSKQLFRIFGLESDSRPLTIEDMLTLVHEDDRQAVREGFRSAMISECVISLSVRIKK